MFPRDLATGLPPKSWFTIPKRSLRAGNLAIGAGNIRQALFVLLFLAIVIVWLRGLMNLWPLVPRVAPIGPYRVLGLLASFLLFAIAAWVFGRGASFTRVLFSTVLLLSVLALGLRPVGALLLFLFSSFVLGSLLLVARREPTMQPDALADCLALLTGMAIYMCSVYLLIATPVNYWFTYAALLIAPLLWDRSHTRAALRRVLRLFRAQTFDSAAEYWMFAALALVLTLHWFAAAKPEVSADGLAMHLAIPSMVADLHYWPFDARNLAWAVMPMGGDWCYTLVYLLGGEYAARLLNYAMFLIVAAMLYHAVRWWLPRLDAALAVLLLATLPIAGLTTGNLFVENIWTALALGSLLALWRFHEAPSSSPGSNASLYAAAFLMGAAMTVKYGAVAFALAAAPFLVFAVSRPHPRTTLRSSLAAFALIAIPGATPYLIAFFKTGNPVFPFLNGVFHSPWIDSTRSLTDASYAALPAATFLYELTFKTSKYLEMPNGALGFQYFLLLPLLLVVIRPNWGFREWSLTGITSGFTLLSLQNSSNARYLYPALAFATLLITLVLAEVRSWSGGPLLSRALRFASLACALLNFYILATSNWNNRPLIVNLFSRAESDAFVEHYAAGRAIVDYLNRTHPAAAAFFIDTTDIAGFQGRVYGTSWHYNGPLARRLSQAASPEEISNLASGEGIRHFIAPVQTAGVIPLPMLQFLDRNTTREFALGNFYVATVKGAAAATTASPPLLLAPGVHEDTEAGIEYRGPWIRDSQFQHQASNGTLTYCDSPDASIRFSFVGSGIRWVFTSAPNRGRASLTLDGEPIAQVDQYSAAVHWQASMTFRAKSEGQHVAEIRILGEATPGSSGKYIDLDQLIVLR